MKISFFLKNYQYRAKIYTSWICMWFLPGSPKQLTCWPVFHDLAHRIAPGQWTVKFGRDVKGLPHQTTGNDCGVFILMYALNFSTDAPLWFTERDIAQIRKWWCIMLMERYQIEGHGQRFSYWTNEAEELLKGALEPVYRVSKKQKTEHEVQFQKSDMCFILELPNCLLSDLLMEVVLQEGDKAYSSLTL
ncbi:uncharacterized protein LOC117553834 isoform X4 [Gymnodraco acuticeps]|nr:uncharacterized protein LOC117553834 isoform X4 [Gymnodraco acuticeps]